MKNFIIKLLVGLSVFILMILFIYRQGSREFEDIDRLLDNGVIFSGKIIDMTVSNNHLFGIIRVKIDSSNVREYSKLGDEYLFPYIIKDSIAEVYTYVPIRLGVVYNKSKLVIHSNTRNLEYIINNEKIKGDLFISTDQTNIRFVQKYTIFKDKYKE